MVCARALPLAEGVVAGSQDPEFRALLVFALTIVLSGTAFYASVEGWGLVDGLSFSVITLTTVGYGDLAPSTSASKLFTVVYILLGVSVLLGFVNKPTQNVERGRSKPPEPGARDRCSSPKRCAVLSCWHHDALSAGDSRAAPRGPGLMRRATLIHNPNAASTDSLSSEEIVARLREAGYQAAHRATAHQGGVAEALHDPGDLVVAAGGDGTVREVALCLREQGLSVPLAILPLGTANNVARTLGLHAPVEALIRGLAEPRPRAFDLGLARGPWGERRFLEAFGFGMFAFGLFTYNPLADKSLPRLLQAVGTTLAAYRAQRWQVALDGEDLSGSYLLVEVMNTSALGLRLPLSPDADPGDGLFDVVLVEEDQRVGLAAYLANLVAGKLESLPNVTIKRGRELKLLWDGSPLHWDEELWPEPGAPAADVATPAEPEQPLRHEVTVTLDAGALTLWLPTLTERA